VKCAHSLPYDSTLGVWVADAPKLLASGLQLTAGLRLDVKLKETAQNHPTSRSLSKKPKETILPQI